MALAAGDAAVVVGAAGGGVADGTEDASAVVIASLEAADAAIAVVGIVGGVDAVGAVVAESEAGRVVAVVAAAAVAAAVAAVAAVVAAVAAVAAVAVRQASATCWERSNCSCAEERTAHAPTLTDRWAESSAFGEALAHGLKTHSSAVHWRKLVGEHFGDLQANRLQLVGPHWWNPVSLFQMAAHPSQSQN